MSVGARAATDAGKNADTSADTSAGAGAGTVPWTAYAALTASMLLAGLCVTLGKIALAHLPLLALMGPRCAAAALFLLPFAIREARDGVSVRGTLAGMTARERIDLVAQALFGIVLFTLLMLGGVRFTTAGEAGLIAATLPLVILVLALPLLGEPLRMRPAIAALIATLGIAVITFAGGEGSAGAWRWLGNLLIAGAVVAEALYTIFAKRLAARLPPATMALLMNLVGLLLFAPLLATQPWRELAATVPWEGWAIGALYGMLTSGLALILWYRGTRHVPGGRAGLFTVFLPVGAILSGALLLGETLGPREWLGGGVIALALVIGLLPSRRRGTLDTLKARPGA